MEKRTILFYALTAILIVGFTGCASSRNARAFRFEEILVRSGFQVKSADTPEKLAHLKKLPQDKLIPHTYKGKKYYIFPNAEAEGIYIGTEENYENFKQNLREAKANSKKETTWAQDMEEMTWMGDCYDWCEWGAWYDVWLP